MNTLVKRCAKCNAWLESGHVVLSLCERCLFFVIERDCRRFGGSLQEVTDALFAQLLSLHGMMLRLKARKH